MVAVKENREYTITEVDKDSFIKEGYDIYENGKVIAYGAGKKIPFEKHMEEVEALKKEIESLKEELAKSKATRARKTEK